MARGSRKRPVPRLLAKKLRRIRERLGIGQLEMSKLLSKTPSPPDGGMVSRFERGEREPNLFVILAYSKVAGVSPALLIDDDWSVRDLVEEMPKKK
jgi:transcriptional regulator with XRE-family HTH domain